MTSAKPWPKIGHLTLCNEVMPHSKVQTEVNETVFREGNLYTGKN